MKEILIDIVTQAAQEMAELMKENIMRGDRFVPNAPATVRRKGFNHPLYEHGDLVNSITYQVVEEGGTITGRVGVFDSRLEGIAITNEFGNDRIPPRPFLRLTFDENIDEISQKMISQIFDRIEKVMKEW